MPDQLPRADDIRSRQQAAHLMDDHAQLRRFLVDEGCLAREAGRRYRRVAPVLS